MVALGTAWVHRSPSLLGARTGINFVSDTRPVQFGGFAGIALPDPESHDEQLTFHDTPSVHFSRNTAAATARIAVCVNADSVPTLAGYLTNLDLACSQVRYVKNGTRVRWSGRSNNPREYLILVVTPTRPGVATVDRVTYDYEQESGRSGVDESPTFAYTIKAS